MTDTDAPDVEFSDLPVQFTAAGLGCLVDVGTLDGIRSHFVGYVDLPASVDAEAIVDFLEAPGGITYQREDRVGFDTSHAYMLNVRDDGRPLPAGPNLLEARHESEMTNRYTAQRAADETARLAKRVRRIAEGTPHYD